MILTLIISLILIGGFFIGLRQGFVLQFVNITGFIVSLVIASLFFNDVAPHLTWIPYPGESGSYVAGIYYQAIAFLILLIGTKILWNILGSILNALANLPLISFVNRWIGGAFGFVKIYLVLFLFLNLAALVPMASLQQAVSDSTLAQTMLQHTPVLSAKIDHL
ncbi:CvpA family protein [Oceanobacillus jeddahense]|uniref:CvpA family protein n=1 Tax=Oceanobacillus jeddahense TaxID=1462527 RepID=A0ABY5JZ65_9BACI|nr:CvpA family protein [Oceanobacillus jeddahense]UUI04346.1 CvpA family protein [Oceanobacillus jeddahense]